jgi:type I restriction enzyme M protein
MGIKKSELYSSLWASCDALRGGMDASQYKDYVLVLLFVKYVSDRYYGDPNALIVIPEGGSFKDMVALKGKSNIGDGINKIIGALAKANDLMGVITEADFNNEEKLGTGKHMVDTLSELISIFENSALDFSRNRADGDDILGDAYEYLMRNFATESGKSKGQFYTPAEVSRIMAKVIGIKNATSRTQAIYDPTCGSGSLLLKAAAESDANVTIYGQEKEVATAALARMNMILHNNPTAEIAKGQSTLSNPLFKNEYGNLKTFDFVVANPPFSSKNWASGFDPANDVFGRFDGYGMPPAKNGDFAFLLHIIKSLKSNGKGACILPHGVLFRGNAEAEIRKNIIKKGYIKGIIGLPANLFYGTGIPACIIVVDKENAERREGIFMIDASKGYIKDGNKNRLREQDIHKIVDVFNKQQEIPKYSRLVPILEISDPKNDYNLNIPRYIDSQEQEDIQDIEAHLLGGIPKTDIDALEDYWKVYPSLKAVLFADSDRPKYCTLKIPKESIKQTIFKHPEFVVFSQSMDSVFEDWKARNTTLLKNLSIGLKPKQVAQVISEDILRCYENKSLLDNYDVYQHLMNYWNDVMQDDCYIIAVDGWKAEVRRIVVENKQKKQVDKGWACDLVPKELIVNRFFLPEKKQLDELEGESETIATKMQEIAEENVGEDGLLEEVTSDSGKISKGAVQKRLKELESLFRKSRADEDTEAEMSVLREYLSLIEQDASLGTKIKAALAELDEKLLKQYKTLTEDEVKVLVVDDKWTASIQQAIKTEMERISQRLTQRIIELAVRYETPMPEQSIAVAKLEATVATHLQKMGFVWS